MALLKLSDIGKIYVSEGNVAVGIRGVNLEFERGEFVAVTGKSGSGKSTLLNVISGMDTYEEGDLLIEGESTAHYLQPEWEEYREKYISFIFQDYNIIESFTVLENVELALMHIEDKKERRRRATELLVRVGMASHLNHKGSKLSGGQKQRTVIARALAKDSPIILADEPTGNLDSATGREIIALLREVSKDKLLIIVTHNFDEVSEVATRHVRIFDGAVEADTVLREPEKSSPAEQPATKSPSKKRRTDIKNGIDLGLVIFKAKPRLTAFLCILMLIGSLVIFFVTSSTGGISDLLADHPMFTPIDGRVVLTHKNGAPVTDSELKGLSEKYGAEGYLHFDKLLDDETYVWLDDPNGYSVIYVDLKFTYGESLEGRILGRMPETDGEVLLSLPISYMDEFGKDELLITELEINNTLYTVSGVHYFIDNNLDSKAHFTKSGFETATAISYIAAMSDPAVFVGLSYNNTDGIDGESIVCYNICPTFALPEGKMYIKPFPKDSVAFIEFNATYYKYDHYYYDSAEQIIFSEDYSDEYLIKDAQELGNGYSDTLYIHPSLLRSLADKVLSDSYKQASLFFDSNKTAKACLDDIRAEGYIAVMSNTEYIPDAFETVLVFLGAIFSIVFWILAIVFIAFFINLCSQRALGAFKQEMAIMRSMGIKVVTVRVAMYVRMLLTLLPSTVLVIVCAFFIFRSPALNALFTYLYPWQYALIFIGMILLTVRVTHIQIAKLFRTSVKKSLKGGAEK